MTCPNCGEHPWGKPVVNLHSRGTETKVEAVVCLCGTIYCSNDQRDDFRDRLYAVDD